jgi:homocitrate synthase NifV
MKGESFVKTTLIIDRTLPEIYPVCRKMSRLDILDLCWLLKGLGTDLIEIDSDILKKIGKLPDGLDFTLRIRCPEDLRICVKNRIKKCILRKPILSSRGIAGYIADNVLDATLEVRVNAMEGISRLGQLEGLEFIKPIKCIRVTGLNAIASPEWLNAARDLCGVLGRKIDVCPGNRFDLGSSLAYEAAAGGLDSVTASFMGVGGYAPLEELVMALKVANYTGIESDLNILQELRAFFIKHTRYKISPNKAVIGESIFKYEDGVNLWT